MKRNLTGNIELNKKIDETILRSSELKGGEFKRLVDKLTFDPADFFETQGFSVEEAKELVPVALDVRKELIKEYRSSNPDFVIAAMPIDEIDEVLYEAASKDVYVCETILTQIDRYFANDERQKPGKVVALLTNSEQKVRFGGLKALDFNHMKARSIVMSSDLCACIADIIAKRGNVSQTTSEEEEDSCELTATEEKSEVYETVCYDTDTKDNQTKDYTPETLAQKLLINQDIVAELLSAYSEASKVFSIAEINKILSDKKLQSFVALCKEIS